MSGGAVVRGLLVVDVQVDFCEGGSLGVDGGRQVAQDVSTLLAGAHGYDVVVASQDWHVDPEGHFSETPDFVRTWPEHCLASAPGSDLQEPLHAGLFDAVVRKGEHAAAYSAFEGLAGTDTLAELLRARGVTELDVCGIATDHCVRASVLDARTAGFPVRVLLAMCAGVAPETTRAALEELSDAGAELVR